MDRVGVAAPVGVPICPLAAWLGREEGQPAFVHFEKAGAVNRGYANGVQPGGADREPDGTGKRLRGREGQGG